MGVNNSKVKDSHEKSAILCTAVINDENVAVQVPATPTNTKEKNEQKENKVEQNEFLLDPRSPNYDRTPIRLPSAAQQRQVAIPLDNPLAFLRKHLFKGALYSLNDPRSPSQQMNRTPLFIDAANEKAFNLDDTFSNLSVETRTEGVALNDIEHKTGKPTEVRDLTSIDVAGGSATSILLSSTPK